MYNCEAFFPPSFFKTGLIIMEVLVDKYVKVIQDIIKDKKITRNEWMVVLLKMMELIDTELPNLTNTEKKALAMRVLKIVLVDTLRYLEEIEIELIERLIDQVIIPVSKGGYDINKAKNCCKKCVIL